MSGRRRRLGWPRPWRRRWQRWWEARHPRSAHCTLTQRNVYILPTAAGWLFLGLLAVLLLASINYQLNLGYLLTFVLGGIGLASMYATHATLRGLQLQARPGEAVFAGEVAQLQIRLADPGPPGRRGRARHGIGLRLTAPHPPEAVDDGSAPPPAPSTPPGDDGWTWLDLAAGGEQSLALTQPLPRRGWHAAGTVTLQTRYPFGLFRAWSPWRPAVHWLAWPAPEPAPPPLPLGSAATPTSRPPAARPAHPGDEDPSGLRPWRRGDSLAVLHWRRSAQSLAAGGPLLSREHAHAPPGPLQLDWAGAGAADDEQRIARLTAWVLAAERAGQPYALRLPDATLPSGLGPAQQQAALLRLACWGLAPPASLQEPSP